MSEKRFVIGDVNIVMLLKRVIMMSDGRFEIDVDHLLRVWDTESNKRLTVDEVVDLLNEQQVTIQQKDKQLQKAKEYFMDYLSREMSANNFSEMWDLVIDDE